MNRVTLAIVALFSAASVLYWQVLQKRDNKLTEIQVVETRPDYVIDDLSSQNYNAEGQLDNSVTAVHMEHFDSSNMTFFTEPVYLVYPTKGQTQWRLSAKTGNLNKNTGKVILKDNVIIDAISPKDPIQSLSTSVLELDLNTMIMTSDEIISITGANFIIQGKGLYADLNAQEVELLSQVEGKYETN